MIKYLLPVFLFSLCSVLSGCSGGDIASVSGTVTYDEQPLKNATITFQPEAGRPSSATTDEQGHYELQYTPKQNGAEIGKHKVLITTYQSTEETTIPERLPEKYHAKSQVYKEVEPGSNVIDFKLTSN